MTNHPNRSRQRSQRIAAEVERWAPILRGLSPYEAAERILERTDMAAIHVYGETLAGALLAVAGEGWQPIDTAPKDGRTIICWPQDSEHATAYWSGSCWRIRCCGQTAPPLTHWRPLPAPPADSEPQGEQG